MSDEVRKMACERALEASVQTDRFKRIKRRRREILKKETVEDMFQHHLTPEATAGHQAMLSSPMGPFFKVGIEDARLGHGLGGAITLEDVEGWI